jgi:hypothetical protein
MKYIAKGSISFYDERGINLKNSIDYLIDKANIKISSVTPYKMEIEIILDHEDSDEAQLILNNITNLIGFYENIPIKSFGITSTQKFDDSDGSKSISISDSVRITGTIALMKDTNGEDLKNNLIKGILSSDFQSDIALYREAMKEDNSIAKYILLYRLFESLFNNRLEDINIWIYNEEPNVEWESDRNRGRHTKYTYIRDFIAHPKNKKISVSSLKIGDYVSKLQNYVNKKIREKYQI